MTTILSGAQVSPSGDPGPLPPAAVSADTGNIATLGSDNLILVPQQTIWYQRLRAFNALGNPTFECDARTAAIGTSAAGTFALDRWIRGGPGIVASAVQSPVASGNVITLPNTNFGITSKYLRVTLTTQKPTLAATDNLLIYQHVEGPRLRELINDVHSVSILCRGPANFSFGFWMRDSGGTYMLTLLCTLGAVANIWTLITLPNLAVWTPAGTYSLASGTLGYDCGVCLAAGSSQTTTANGVWLNNGGFFGALGQSNFAAQPANAIFDLAYIGHEPGPLATTPQDISFDDNLLACGRYWQKTWDYSMAIANVGNQSGMVRGSITGTQVQINPGATFPIRMAKDPTVTAYSPSTGAAGMVRAIGAGADKAATTSTNVGETGYVLNLSTALAAADSFQWHHVADTGW
jgi:hypothetical protein